MLHHAPSRRGRPESSARLSASDVGQRGGIGLIVAILLAVGSAVLVGLTVLDESGPRITYMR